jgi:cytochrome c553
LRIRRFRETTRFDTYLFKNGERNGLDAQLMKKPVAQLTDSDIVAISAYLGSLAH